MGCPCPTTRDEQVDSATFACPFVDPKPRCFPQTSRSQADRLRSSRRLAILPANIRDLVLHPRRFVPRRLYYQCRTRNLSPTFRFHIRWDGVSCGKSRGGTLTALRDDYH